MTPSEIVERFYTPLFRFAWALVGDREGAASLAREVFGEWLSSPRETLTGDEVKVSLFSALFRRFGAGTNQLPARREAATEPDTLLPVEVERSEADTLLASLGELEVTQRAVLMLFYGARCSAFEIGAILDLSSTSVSWALTRGKAEWREILARSGGERDPASSDPIPDPRHE